MLTGRYRLKTTFWGGIRLEVEEGYSLRRPNFSWRTARASDFKALEPMVADGWRFPEERTGVLCTTGKRYKE